MRYDHKKVETKWQQYWLENKTFKAQINTDKEKFYCLDMFPYPSGAGLHVGHPLGYTATDIICRKKRHEGREVLHPIGWDAFGLPAENYAIKTGVHPRVSTQANIDNFRRQIRSLGFSYDWDREVDTTDAQYVKWTQWIFQQLYKKGLAYEKKMPMNWCPKCKVVAANEEVEGGMHERCGNVVERRNMRQWMLRITEYAERLLQDLDTLDEWPEKIKAMQRNWIGKSEGCEIDFDLSGETVTVYTTRPDTLYGCTYMVLAPEHPMVEKIVTPEHAKEVEDYIRHIQAKSDLERTELNKEKTGVFTGAYAINPVNNEKVPVWIADYVLMTYGTGAVMAVPAHDARDYEFAKKYNLPVKEVVVAPKKWKPTEDEPTYCGKDGMMLHSGMLDDKNFKDAFETMAVWLEENKKGKKKINYRLRDWVFSRNRYWGEPIPLVHREEDGAIVLLPESELPLELPEIDDYHPADDGNSPLDKAVEWVETVCPETGKPAKRETLTMPNWAGSSWYWLRYMDPDNEQSFCSKEAASYWGPVDLYVGGAEHAVLHLLYARFWHKVFYDLGLVSTIEPFASLKNQGLILAEDGVKMSKSLGNVVNPDEIVEKYGADTLRVYEMFMGPFEQPKRWSGSSVDGVRKFLDRVWRVTQKPLTDDPMPKPAMKALHEAIQVVGEHIDTFRFNTAVSQLMVLTNELTQHETINKEVLETYMVLLSPMAPHLAEEVWKEVLGHEGSIAYQAWPTYDPAMLVVDEVTYAIQVNGKVRETMTVSKDMSQRESVLMAKDLPKVSKYLEEGEIKKEIFVPGKIIGFVVK